MRPCGRIELVLAASIAALAAVPTTAGDAGSVPSHDPNDPAALRARGLYSTYSLDYDQARDAYRQAITADPSDPAAYRQLAAVNWLNVLFRNGAVLVDDYLGEAKQQVKRGPPPADLDAQFREAIERARILSEQRLRGHPNDPDAHFQVGATLGFIASYTATVDGRVLDGFRAARRAYDEHERVLELNPSRKDAGLVVGLYRYAVSQLPIYWRLLAHLAGFGGGRDRGLRMVEETAAYPSDAQPEARFVLIVMYSREQRFDDALRVIEQLQRDYPRNRLLWLEAGSTALRAGRAGEARRQLETGLTMLARDERPRAFGEEARWRLAYGAALVALHDSERAERELRTVLKLDAMGWVRGRAHKALGEIAAGSGDRARAADEYLRAIRLCRAEEDMVCTNDAKQLMSRMGGNGAVRP